MELSAGGTGLAAPQVDPRIAGLVRKNVARRMRRYARFQRFAGTRQRGNRDVVGHGFMVFQRRADTAVTGFRGNHGTFTRRPAFQNEAMRIVAEADLRSASRAKPFEDEGFARMEPDRD